MSAPAVYVPKVESDRNAPGGRSVKALETAIFVALVLGAAWTIVAQFYNPSAGYDSFPMPVGKVIELGVFAIAVILTVGYRHRRSHH